jgi:hypothetical protein
VVSQVTPPSLLCLSIGGLRGLKDRHQCDAKEQASPAAPVFYLEAARSAYTNWNSSACLYVRLTLGNIPRLSAAVFLSWGLLCDEPRLWERCFIAEVGTGIFPAIRRAPPPNHPVQTWLSLRPSYSTWIFEDVSSLWLVLELA